jgi:hypothetical protein
MALVAVGPAAFSSTTAQSDQTTAASWKPYFRAHSLEFPMMFRAHHPGPAWVLGHAKQLDLSPAQIKDEKALAMGMVAAAKSAVATLQVKYADYAKDAALPNPALEQITTDIDAVGKAQIGVGTAMIPYHLKAYAVLDARQQALFRKLVAAAMTSHA